jgi:hypothetical protein
MIKIISLITLMEQFKLLYAEILSIAECLRHIKGNEILIFIPEKDRPKKHIGFGG